LGTLGLRPFTNASSGSAASSSVDGGMASSGSTVCPSGTTFSSLRPRIAGASVVGGACGCSLDSWLRHVASTEDTAARGALTPDGDNAGSVVATGSVCVDSSSRAGFCVTTEGDADAARSCSSRLEPTAMAGDGFDVTANGRLAGCWNGDVRGRGYGRVVSLKRFRLSC
jgi:hypothetical protein